MVQVKTSITPETLKLIDQKRGRLSRSGFIAQILEKTLFPEKKQSVATRFQERAG
jgi:hypothetical protein